MGCRKGGQRVEQVHSVQSARQGQKSSCLLVAEREQRSDYLLLTQGLDHILSHPLHAVSSVRLYLAQPMLNLLR